MQVLTHAQGGCVVHRCQNKKPRERLTSGCEWRPAPEARGGFWNIWKSQLSWVLPLEKTVGFRLPAEARPEALGWCRTRWGGGQMKSQNRKNEYLSPYVEEPLYSKVIKSFVSELRSHKCFSCFEIPMFYVYIYIYEHYERFAYRYEYVHFMYGYGTGRPVFSSRLHHTKDLKNGT